MDRALIAAGWALCAFWSFGLALPLAAQWYRRFSRLVKGLELPDAWPALTVVVTAKDEGDRLSLIHI